MTSRPETSSWSAASWRTFPAAQQPEWPDADALKQAEARLSTLPPLVFAGEARHLTSQLAEVADGNAFLLQAGDCAESFAEFTADSIRDKLKIILQMAVALTYAAGVPVVKVGRIAGQFAKPRSAEHRAGRRRGAAVVPRPHGQRRGRSRPRRAGPIPSEWSRAYQQSASTLNLLRAFTKGGFADLSQVHLWNQQFVASSAEGRRYERIASEIDRALRFMAACGIDLGAEEGLHQVDFWTSHEALILPYEECLTRHGLADRRLVRLLGPHGLGRRPHPPARRRPPRVPLGHPQPGGRQDRARLHARRGRRASASASTRTACRAG